MRRVALLAAVAGLAIGPAGPVLAAPGPAGAPQYWFDDWHVQSLWKSGARGQGVTIAEIDTGVNADLPELRGRVLRGKDFGGSGDGRTDREVDGFGHGTAMASIMVAHPGLLDITGLAPDAKILPVAVALTGTTDAGRPDMVPEAIRWAADHSAKIINLSLGAKRSPRRDDAPCSTDEQAAIYHAIAKGALVIASVGNTGPTANTVEDPGACLGVIAVGADKASGAVADFSARQPYLTLVAPGVDIASLGREPGTAYAGDGTSQATALTSATAALVWSAHPELDARGVAARIIATLDGRRTTPSRQVGFGRLNAYRAVTGRSPGSAGAVAIPSSAADPVFATAERFISRSQALAKVHLDKPAPAAKPIASTGSFEVGSHPRLTPEVITGIALAGAGALLLLVLLAVGLRGRAVRRRPVAAFGPPLVAGPVGQPGPVGQHGPASWPAPARDPDRPRPGPGVRPEPAPDRPRPRPRRISS